MSKSMYGYCGTVTQDGKITSNGNFSCKKTNTGIFQINYNGATSNPVPVISPTGESPGMTYVITPKSDGFDVYIYGSNMVPISSGFNFIVAEIL